MTNQSPNVGAEEVPPGGIPTVPETGYAPLPEHPDVPEPDDLSSGDLDSSAEERGSGSRIDESSIADVEVQDDFDTDDDAPPPGLRTFPES